MPARSPQLTRQNAFALVSKRFPPYFADQPFTKYVKLRYTQGEAIPSLSALSLNTRTFRANDLYDPDYAVGGHQPYGFDQLMAQYQHFTVIASRMTVTLENTAEYKQANFAIVLTNSPGEAAAAYAAGGASAIMEMPRHSAELNAAIDGARDVKRSVSYWFDAQTDFHKSLTELVGNTPYSGGAATSPAEDAYFEVVCYNSTGQSVAWTTSAIKYTIEYYAVFSEPKYFNPS